MIKIIGLMKRKPGMTLADFRSYYETRHSVLAEKIVGKYMCKYVRNYLTPLQDDNYGRAREPLFDCVMELWYPDQESFLNASNALSEPDNLRINVEDMQQLFDIEACEFFTAEECETSLQ